MNHDVGLRAFDECLRRRESAMSNSGTSAPTTVCAPLNTSTNLPPKRPAAPVTNIRIAAPASGESETRPYGSYAVIRILFARRIACPGPG